MFVFVFLYIVIDLLSSLEDILKQHVAIRLLIKYYLTYIPIIFSQVAPFSCLLATLYTFAKLNRSNEIIALRASGLSILSISKSVLVFGLIISTIIFWTGESLVPMSMAFKKKLEASIENPSEKAQDKDKESVNNLSIYGLGNRLFFINKFLPDKNTMEGIIILEHDKNQNVIKKIIATKGIYKKSHWVFYDSCTYDLDVNGQFKQDPRYLTEETMTIPETPYEFLAQRQQPDLMTTSQLKDYIDKLAKCGATTVVRNLKVDLYQRYTSPFLCLIIIFLAIPFSLKIKKFGTGISSLGISIIMAFSYYVINAISIALGKAGFLTPVLSVSLSHIITLAVSFYLISEMS